LKALTLSGPFEVRYESVPDPVVMHPGDAIVRVDCGAICGSDLHVYRGHEKGLDSGTTMGHEFAGTVIEVGSEVSRVRVGMRVTSPFSTNCGSCDACRCGLTARCENGGLFGWVEGGQGLQGVQAEYARVPLADTTLVEIPDGIGYEDALFTGDILATGTYGVLRADVRAGHSVAVIGCGPVGLMAVLAAFQSGAQAVYAIDGIPERLALATGFGAHAVDFSGEDVVARIVAETEGLGVHAVVEAVGHPSATRLAFDLLRPGGTLSAVGVHTEEHFAFSPGDAYDKNITYRAGRCPARALMDDLLASLPARKLRPTDIVSHRMPLSEGVRGYKIFDGKQEGCTKVLLVPDDGPVGGS
jgi:threonine dehydrogenase-like Zn-dependent dehydrogenase